MSSPSDASAAWAGVSVGLLENHDVKFSKGECAIKDGLWVLNPVVR